MLLTPVQLGPIIGMEPHYVDDYELSICRAQVRKVVDEWGKRQGVCVSGSTPCEFAGVSAERCFICQFQDFIEALKMAVREMEEL